MSDTATPHTLALARSLCEFSSLVDVPCPDEPGVRVVGFKYLEAQAGMGEALCALTAVRDAFMAPVVRIERVKRKPFVIEED